MNGTYINVQLVRKFEVFEIHGKRYHGVPYDGILRVLRGALQHCYGIIKLALVAKLLETFGQYGWTEHVLFARGCLSMSEWGHMVP